MVIGAGAKMAPMKHSHGSVCEALLTAAEDRFLDGAVCPLISVVLGDVMDIGEGTAAVG